MAGEKPQTESFLGRFTVLKGAMRELWVVFGVKFIALAAYGVMNSTLVLWLSADLGYSDEYAGFLVAGWSIAMTVFTILAGSLTDAIGLRRTFLLGVVICVVARLVMTVTTAKWLALAGGLFPLAIGEALGTPVLVAAIRRYSTTAQRSISFSTFYVMMNLGFFVAYEIFDFVRKTLGEHGQLDLPLVGIQISTYQMLFLVSLGIEVILLPIIYFGIRGGAEATDEGVRITPETPKHPDKGLAGALCLTVRDTLRDTGRNLASLARQPGFYRLLGFLTLIAFVKLIFMQMYYVYPKFGVRELGEGAPFGGLWGINSVLIIFLVPIVGALTQRSSAYRMVTLGAMISAGSVFVMALPTTWFQGLADGTLGDWLGHKYLGVAGPVNPWYVVIFLYVVVLSFGEAIYSPRVYEYAASIAPKGQEAAYGALSYVPMFLAKLVVGTVSGVLLSKYCPETTEHGPRQSGTMWLIIALITMIAPIGLITLRRWIRVPEAGRNE
ncbi:MAG: MFS transporter [Phycisphaerae bacterium]|nr:MFS transporter [Phycisphaerae bacterium]